MRQYLRSNGRFENAKFLRFFLSLNGGNFSFSYEISLAYFLSVYHYYTVISQEFYSFPLIFISCIRLYNKQSSNTFLRD